jgi:hypothetical protein
MDCKNLQKIVRGVLSLRSLILPQIKPGTPHWKEDCNGCNSRTPWILDFFGHCLMKSMAFHGLLHQMLARRRVLERATVPEIRNQENRLPSGVC